MTVDEMIAALESIRATEASHQGYEFDKFLYRLTREYVDVVMEFPPYQREIRRLVKAEVSRRYKEAASA